MKTSKRILSFFLAVVMALTACSAGFVAFAREINPKDNSPFSDANASAEKSTDALNGLLDSLIPTILDAIGDEKLASIGLDKNKIVNASFDDESIKSDRFYELMNELSVWLYPQLNGASMESVLKEERLSSGDAKTDAANYAYLENQGSGFDFWTLYSMCKSNAKADGNEFQQLCYKYYNGYTAEDGTEVMGLKELLFAQSVVSSEMAVINENTGIYFNELAQKIGLVQTYGDQSVTLNKSVDEIQALIDAYEAANGKIVMVGDDYDYELIIKATEKAVKFLDPDASCTTLAETFYYRTLNMYALSAAEINLCLIAAGHTTAFPKYSLDSWFDTVSQQMPYEMFLQAFDFSAYDGITDEGKAGVYYQFMSMFFYQTVLEGASSVTENASLYRDYITGALAELGYSTIEETNAGIDDLILSDDDIRYLMSNPEAPAYDASQGGVTSTAGKILGQRNRFRNYVGFDLGNYGFSEPVKLAILRATDSEIDDFRAGLRTGNIQTALNSVPNVVAAYTRDACETYASNFASAYSPLTILGSQAVNEYAATKMDGYVFNGDYYPVDEKYYFQLTASTIDGYISMAKDIDGLIESLAGMNLGLDEQIDPLISGLTQIKDKDGNGLTYEQIIDSVDGIYSNLAFDPAGTIANVVPLLVVVIDELLVPLLFNGEDDAFHGVVGDLLNLISGLGNIGTTINELFDKYGITSVNFDLNYIIPAVVDYIATGSTAKATLGVYDNITTDDGGEVPILTTIGALDKLLAEKACNCKFVEGKDAGIAELVKSVFNVLNKSVDDYMAAHSTNETAEAKIGKNMSKEDAVLVKGFNNLFVAIPTLIDTFVNNFLALYNVDTDWTFKARIAHSTGTDANGVTYQLAENVTLTDVKEHIFDTGSDRDSSNVTSWIVNLLVNDWINAIVDLLNDVFTTENDISNNIPIITNLLNSLGGFGETSIISDALNGLFYLTRNSKYSFAFGDQAIPCAQNGETYVGFSDDSAYYLVANIGPIIEIVMDIVNANPPEDPNAPVNPDTPEKPNTTKLTPVVINYDDAKEILTKENEKASETLIAALDKLLSTLFENTYLNGYAADKLDGVLSGVVTALVNQFGKTTTDKILKLVTKYLEVISADSVKSNFAPKRNVNSSGPVDAKKVYTNKGLSTLVTETYALIEEILDEVINIKGDDNDYIVNAIDGIFSPSSIAIRSSLDDGIMDYLTWCELSATKYATDLGFDFSAGDKDAFYDNLFEALAPVTAIVGALFSSESTSLYDSLINPIFASICDKCGVELYTPADTTGKEYAKAIIFPIAEVLNKFLEAPASTLISLLQGLSDVLKDSSIRAIIRDVLPPILGEINGLGNIVAVLSPTLAESVTGLADTIDNAVYLVTSVPDIVNTLLTDLPIKTVELTVNFDWEGFANLSKGNALLVIYDLALKTVLDLEVIQNLIRNAKDFGGNKASLIKIISKLEPKAVFEALTAAIKSVRTPTEVLWTFEDYLAKETNTFKYPSGITASEADDAVDSLDNLVKNIFPLLQSLGVLDYNDLSSVVNGLLFKNEMITKIATAVYGGIEKAAASNASVNFTFTPAQFAEYLMDKSYGNTYSEAAAALKKCSSWSQVKDINWGFKDGSAKAEQGFINALAALCRPANDVLAVLLAGGELRLGDIAEGILSDLDVVIKNDIMGDKKDANGNVVKDKNGKPVQVKTGTWTMVIKDRNLGFYFEDDKELYNSLVVSLDEIIALLNNAGIMGGNGYQSAIIPLLEALMCDGVKTNAQYINDYNKAKDNLVINILNPLFGFVDKVLEKPFDTITAVLPNVAYFIENNGIAQLLNNLLSPITQMLPILKQQDIDVNAIIEAVLGKSLGDKIAELIGADVKINLDLNNLNACDIQNALIPIINAILKNKNIDITLPDFDWATLASHGTQTTFDSAAGGQGIRIIAKQGETLIAVLRYLADVIISNANGLKTLICGIDGVAKNKTIVNILTTIFNQLSGAHEDDIVKAIFYLLTQDPQNSFFDYRDFKFEDYDFSYPSTVDVEFLTNIGPMLDGLIGGLVEGGLNKLIGDMIYKDDIISSLVCGLYGAVEGVKINDNMNLAQLLAQTDIDFTTANVAKLLTDKDYGQSYASVAKTIEKAGSWSKVNKDSLHWGVTDRDSFVHALCAALRPIYGVLDVLLNDGSLGLFKLIYLPGSDGYTSAIVPLMEAFGLYNIKTQYQYRQDMSKEYDAILLDILNPLLDKVEDILNAPIEMLCDILPNLSLFFANDGLLQLIDNLLLPITALLDSLKPIVDVNDLLKALGLDIEKEISKLGLNVKGFKFDIYDLSATLKPLIGAENIVGLLNSVLGLIKIGGSPLGIKLMPIDWYQLASHGELITDEASQAATFGARMYVKADQSEVLIAVLRYLINTINYEDNFNTISNLIGGLLGNASDSISDIVSQVLGMLSGDTDEVISSLCDLLQTLA